MLNDGTEHISKLSQATLTYTQLIVLNYTPNSTGAVDKTRETPSVSYNALSLNGRFCSKCIFINQFHIGLFCSLLENS